MPATVRTLSGRGALDRARRNSQRQSRPRGHRAVVRREFSDETGRGCPTGRRIGSGQPPAQHKSIAGGSLFPAPAAIVPGPEPESHGAGVSRFAENGSHLVEVDAAEGHAEQVGGLGSSGNAGIGSHPAATDAAEGHAGQVDGPGSSGNTGIGSHLEMAPVTNAPGSRKAVAAATCRGPCGASGRNACP